MEQTPKSRKNILHRQDWVRSKIRLIGNGKYYAENADCYFETRKGLAKGYYLLRLSINVEERPTLCSVSIEPVGPNKSLARTFNVSIRSTETEPYLVLPIVVIQRSRVKIKPVNSQGEINATISVLPTAENILLNILRQWTTRKPKGKDNAVAQETYSITQEIAWRTEQIYRLAQIRHQTWQKAPFNNPTKHEPDKKYENYLKEIEPKLDHKEEQIRKWLDLNRDAPLISIIVPTYNTNSNHLRECIESVCRQSYPNWELCICDDSSGAENIKTILKGYQSADPRIKLIFRKKNGHICEASNDALSLATGEYVALLDHDDILADNALYWIARELQKKAHANLIYSDEDKVNDDGIRSCPHFKPAFNIDLLLSYNFISHLGVYRRDILKQIGGFRVGYEGSQDHDLALRTALESSPDQIIHIPRVLYHWRAHSESTASNPDSKDYTTESGHRAVQDFLDEQHRRGGVKATARIKARNRFTCQWEIPEKPPSVELIIPTRDQSEVLNLAIDSIFTKTTYTNYTITIVDNQSTNVATKNLFKRLKRVHAGKINIIKYNKRFNYSAINNFAVGRSRADIIVLVNNDVEVISGNWLQEIVSHASRPDVGCVGAKLYYSNGTIQHGGVIIGIGKVAGHAHKYFPGDSPGYIDRLQHTQQVTAVTAACLAIRREIYNKVGGLNQQDLTIAFNDVDFCMRVHARGYRNIFTPYAELFHHESISRGAEDSPEKQKRFKKEINFMLNQYDVQSSKELPSDLFYNPNLTKVKEDFSINTSPESVRQGIELRSNFMKIKDYYQR